MGATLSLRKIRTFELVEETHLMFWLTIMWGFLASMASNAVTTFGLGNKLMYYYIDCGEPGNVDDHLFGESTPSCFTQFVAIDQEFRNL